MEPCPCGSREAYTGCCEPLIKGLHPAQTAEALMRSRYTAYVKADIDYVFDTIHPAQRHNYDRDGVAAWSKHRDWQWLKIIDTKKGGTEDQQGTVEFVARYRKKGIAFEHHEIAEFARKEGRWYFMDGKSPKQRQSVRQGPKIGRNDPCTCGSGRKYKKCCGA